MDESEAYKADRDGRAEARQAAEDERTARPCECENRTCGYHLAGPCPSERGRQRTIYGTTVCDGCAAELPPSYLAGTGISDDDRAWYAKITAGVRRVALLENHPHPDVDELLDEILSIAGDYWIQVARARIEGADVPSDQSVRAATRESIRRFLTGAGGAR